MNCPKCNFVIESNAVFCRNCGSSLANYTNESSQNDLPKSVKNIDDFRPNQSVNENFEYNSLVPNSNNVVSYSQSIKPSIFNNYWLFGLISLVLTPITGWVIILTKKIYRKSTVTNHYEEINNREKQTLIIMLVVLTIIYGIYAITLIN